MLLFFVRKPYLCAFMKNSAFVLLAALALFSCGKKVIPSLSPTPAGVEIREIDFDYFHGKARLVFKDGKKEREVKAHIRIRKDSVIWMTFTVIGLQGGRALINKDSITILSTVDKEYYVFDYETLSKRFNFDVNYHAIQSIFLGNLIFQRSDEDPFSDENNVSILQQRRGSVTIKNFINPTTRKLEHIEMKEPLTGNSITVSYSNFQPLLDKIYPFNAVISIVYKTPGGVVNTTISLEYNKAEVGDKELRFPFNIPRKYDRR